MVARGSSYHFPIFCLIMMRVEAEDQELGCSISLFSYFLLEGGCCMGQDPQASVASWMGPSQ
jgi:hypothetical protein